MGTRVFVDSRASEGVFAGGGACRFRWWVLVLWIGFYLVYAARYRHGTERIMVSSSIDDRDLVDVFERLAAQFIDDVFWETVGCNGAPGSCGHHNNCIEFDQSLAPSA